MPREYGREYSAWGLWVHRLQEGARVRLLVHRWRRQGTGGACHAPLLREGIASAEYRLAMTRPESTRGGYGGRTRGVGTRENRLCVELYWIQPGDQVALYTLRQQLELAVDGFEPHLLGVHGGPAQLFLRFFA